MKVQPFQRLPDGATQVVETTESILHHFHRAKAAVLIKNLDASGLIVEPPNLDTWTAFVRGLNYFKERGNESNLFARTKLYNERYGEARSVHVII